LFDVIGEMDALLSLALVAYDHGLICPRILINNNKEDPNVVCQIQRAFHPLSFTCSSSSSAFMTCTVTKEKRFCLIQKQNSSITSSVQERGMYLIGLILWMCQIGSFVPCEEFIMTQCFDAIFVRYGTRDAQLYGHSTFMTEMLDITAILKRCTSSSLVLIDELCFGTAQDEAVALGYAICYELIERQTTCVLATSNETLLELLNSKLGAKIAHLFDDQEVEPKKKSQQEKDE
jgi:DNA mismatch repair ATPase MutS